MTQDFYIPATESRAAVLERIVKMLWHLPVKRWHVEISEHKPLRSDTQNAFLWATYQDILRAGGEMLGGWTKEDLHEYFLGEHFGWKTMTGLGANRQIPMRRSSKLNKQEFTDFIAFIQQRMAEHGIFVRDPQ